MEATSSPATAAGPAPGSKVAPGFARGAVPGFLQWSHLVFSRLNARLEHDSAETIIAWAVETFGTGLAVGTSFGASGIVLIDLVLRIQPDADIFYIDTGYFFPETQALIERVQQHYQRSLRRVLPAQTVEEQATQYGPALYQRDPDLCCYLRKVEPLQAALAGSTAWATAIRRDQADTRRRTPAVAWNERYNVVKVAPLVYWTEAEVWQYIHSHNLPYNELHDRHYPSIGCWPCTRPVQPGEDLRAGRWQGLSKTECGLHLVR
ncbi:MAG TPA: phosphoadenylyl-sulfate reductase [Caldilineaceae bacterium]|nr:phosphoadenylyl-sulfate reductase [Caldilineaceae bacterium]